VRWLVPLTSALIVSGTIAHRLQIGLSRTIQQPPSIIDPTAPSFGAVCDVRDREAQDSDPDSWIPAPSQSDCLLASAEPGARWVTLGAVELDGSVTSLSCLVGPATAIAAVLYVPAEDMDGVVSEACLRTWL
jgi:hypothetical protein